MLSHPFDPFVSRGRPAVLMALLAEAGDDLASRHGTVSTTDWSSLTGDETAMAANEGGVDNEFECVYLFDSDDIANVEIICDCCRGLGHMRRVCPSARNRARSFQYAIAALQSKLSRVGTSPPRRPPGRGQRAPFRAQPRSFQQRRGRFPASEVQRSHAFSRGQPYRPRRALSAEEGDSEFDDARSDSQASTSTTSASQSRVTSPTPSVSCESSMRARSSDFFVYGEPLRANGPWNGALS